MQTPLVLKESLRSFPDKAALLWNIIPSDLRKISNKKSFSSSIKTWIRENIPI